MTTSTTTTTQAPFIPIKETVSEQVGRKFIAKLRRGGPSGQILATSQIVTVENLPSKTSLPNTFTNPKLGDIIPTASQLAYQQKTIASTAVSDSSQTFECYDNRSIVLVTGTTSGNVFGGGSNTPYSEDSNLGAAVVHAGLVPVGLNALVKRISKQYYKNVDPIVLSFKSNTANGVTTFDRREGCGFYFDRSFVQIFTTTTTSTTSTTTSTSTTSTTSTSTTTSTLPAGSPGLFRSTFSNIGPTTSLLIEKSIDAVPTLEGVRTATDPNGFVYDVPQGRYTQHWVGNLFAATTETYTFYCDGVDDVFFLWIGDHTLNPSFNIYDSASANLVVTLGGANSYSIPLTAGIKYPIRMTYIQVTGPASFNFQYSTPTKAKTSDISGLFFSDSSPGTLSTFEVVPSQYAIDEGQPLSFNVNTTNVPIGTRLYWWFNSVEAIDFTTNPGTYVSTTLSGSNPTSNIQASHYEGWINLIYLRQLGRHPENSSVVDGYVADLLTNATTLNDVDSQVYNLPEAASYRAGGASYRRSGDFLTTGSTYTVNGTVIYDSRFEGPQTANILIRTEGHDGPIVANANVLFNDTSQIRGDFNPGPINLVPGYTHTMSFTVLSSAWAGTPFKMEIMPPDGTGAAISANDITVGNQFFTAPSANSYTHTFTITVNAGYTSANPEEWFKLGAKVGATYNGLFVGTANIRVFP